MCLNENALFMMMDEFSVFINLLYDVKEALQVSRGMRKPTFCICENKDADQLRGNREADQRLCFRYTDSTCNPSTFLNPKFQASSHLL